MPKVRLYCLPHAGGSASTYLNWGKFLGQDIELVSIELAGRGKRNNIPLYQDMEHAIDDIFSLIATNLSEIPYAILGHSMGTIIAYELAREIHSHNLPPPVHMFFSGRYPPYLKGFSKKINILPDDEFLYAFAKLGGLSNEVLQNKELIDYILPIMRSDCRIVEEYNHAKPRFVVNCDITVLSGNNDPTATVQELEQWSHCTRAKCHFYSFDDGHFFIHKYRNEVITLIKETLLEEE